VVDGLGLASATTKIDGMSITENYPAMVLHNCTSSAPAMRQPLTWSSEGISLHPQCYRDAEFGLRRWPAMREGQRGLAALLRAGAGRRSSELQQIVARFENAALNDPIARVCRDPRRKLGADERLVGAGAIAEEAGFFLQAALAAAAAFAFHPSDPSAAKLRREIERWVPSRHFGG